MFSFPSVWNIIVSSIVFVIAAWYVRRKLDEHGFPKGIARGLLVFVLAYIVSWASGALIDWSHDKIYGVAPPSQLEQDLNQTLKESGLVLP